MQMNPYGSVPNIPESREQRDKRHLRNMLIGLMTAWTAFHGVKGCVKHDVKIPIINPKPASPEELKFLHREIL